MNVLESPAAAEMRKLLKEYIEKNGAALGKSFFSAHVREIERSLLEEVDREIKAGKIKPRKTAG